MVREAINTVEGIVEGQGTTYATVWEALTCPEAGTALAYQSGLLIAVVVAYGLLLFLTRQTIIVGSRKIEFDLRNEVYAHLQMLPQSYFSSNKQGDIYVRATEDIVRIREYFGPAFMYTVNTLSRAGIIIGMMMFVNSELTLWALIPLPFLSGLAYWMSEYIHKRSLAIQEQYSNLAGRAQEAFSSIRLIKAYTREAYESARFQKESEIYKTKKLSRDFVESLFFPMLNLLIGFSIILVIWKGGEMVMADRLTLGNIAEFIIYVLYLTWPVASLGYTINLIQRSAASNQRLNKLLDEPIMSSHPEKESTRSENESAFLTFENVSFAYPGTEEKVLKQIDFTIPRGSMIGIVGKTGSGKSSLVQLIPRLFDPTEGRILLNGKDIRSMEIEELRSHIGMVPQDIFLFSDTISENIAFGKYQASDEEIEEAAARAQVLENILSFEKKFDTVLGERGITLSGGQKQRTSLARALIRNPRLLILDDSLSAVDTGTEEAILKQLTEGKDRYTTILISHRISTVKQSDFIIVLEDGQIQESGTHQDLLKQQGTYYSMYQKQLLEAELLEI